MSREFYEEAIKLRKSYGWDIKEWSRRIRVNQRILEKFESGENRDDEAALDRLMLLTKEHANDKPSNMLRFNAPVIIASCTHKGGCGKTTCSVGIADALASQGYNVLVIDADGQMDATTTLLPSNLTPNSDLLAKKNIFNALAAGLDLRDCVIPTDYDRLDLVPSSTKMVSAEAMLMSQSTTNSSVENTFRNIIAPLVKENYYDFVFIDMDKNAGYLNRTILNACTHLLMTSECSLYNMTGAAVMKSQYEDIKAKSNADLELLGVILNKVIRRKSIVSAAIEEFDALMPGKQFKATIRNDANVEKAQWQGQTLREFNSRAGAWRDMLDVTDEIIERLRPLSIAK